MQIIYINREKDKQRRENFLKYAPKGFPITRIDAIDGHSNKMEWKKYKLFNRNNFWGKDVFKPGAFACFLSHANAWQALIESNHYWGIICEDDAIFRSDVKLSIIEKLCNNTNYELIHINERLESWILEEKKYYKVYDLNECVNNIVNNEIKLSSTGPRLSPGADGYLINRNAAVKLLNLMKKRGIECGVDWFMIAAGIDGININIHKFLKYGTFGFLTKYFYNNKRVLRSGIIYPHIIKEVPSLVGGSVIKHEKVLSFSVFNET